MKIVKFKSHSGDDYYMKVDDTFVIPNERKDVAKYIRNYLDFEYFDSFKYQYITHFIVCKNGFVFVPLSFNEWDVIDTRYMKKNTFYSSDFIKFYYDKGYNYRAEDVNRMREMKRNDLLEYVKENTNE